MGFRSDGFLVRICRWLAIFFIAAAFLTFLFGTFNCVNLWWYNKGPWSVKEPPTWQIYYNALTSRYEEDGATIYPAGYGSTGVSVFTMCGGTLVAALATFVLRSLPRTSSEGHAASFPGRIWLRVKQVLFFQLPPRRLWLWWCGGFHILDAIIVGAMCALGAIWTEQLTIGYFRYIDGLVDYGTFETYYDGLSLHMAKVEAVGNRTGWLPLAGALLLFYPIPRNSFLQALFKVDFSYLIKYHRWAGHFTMLGTAIHGVIYYVAWGMESRFAQQFRTWQIYSISNLAGNLSFLFGLILWATSLQIVRRHYFETFYRLHIVGFIGFYVFGFLHYNGLWYYSGPGFVLYLLDVTFRLAQWMNVSILTGTLVSHDVLALQLNFISTTKLKPNSFVFLAIPDASRAEWHPFTLSIVQNSTDPIRPAQATIFLKPYGKWAQAVVRRIADKGSALVKVDGPYGGTSTLIEGSCPIAVIFAGGIGVTPMLGLLTAMREMRQHVNQKGGSVAGPQRVVFVWASRNPANFDLLDEHLLAEARQPDSWLEVLLFCTSDTQAHQNGNSNGLNSAPVNGAARDAMLSLQQDTNGGAIPPETLARIDRPELKLSSPFFLKPSLLQSYGIGYPLWALAHCLAFVGAYFGTVIGSYYYVIISAIDVNGCPYWIYNLVMLVGLFVGTMGLPALLIFPVFLWRRSRAQKAVAAGALNVAGMLPTGAGQPDVGKAEAGGQAPYSYGRPNVRSILKNIQNNYSDASEIHVCAAGPSSMVADVKFNCTDLSPILGGGPQFIYEIDSFAL